MSNASKAGMIIRYVDGNDNRLVFIRDDDEVNAVARIEEALKANVLLLALEDRVLAIPFHTIRNIEVTPPPKKLPRYAVTNVRIIS